MLMAISSFILHPSSLLGIILHPSSLLGILAAGPTQEEVFKSIQDNVGEPVDLSKFLPFLAAAAGLIVLVAAITQWRKRDVRPKTLNHQGKLLKEILKSLPLKPAELKQLKQLL